MLALCAIFSMCEGICRRFRDESVPAEILRVLKVEAPAAFFDFELSHLDDGLPAGCASCRSNSFIWDVMRRDRMVWTPNLAKAGQVDIVGIVVHPSAQIF